MSQSPARIFIETGNFDEFREKIVSLNGEFMFDTDEMFRLGEAYFNRYPDSFSHRNSQEVKSRVSASLKKSLSAVTGT